MSLLSRSSRSSHYGWSKSMVDQNLIFEFESQKILNEEYDKYLKNQKNSTFKLHGMDTIDFKKMAQVGAYGARRLIDFFESNSADPIRIWYYQSADFASGGSLYYKKEKEEKIL